VTTWPSYGKLSGRTLEEQEAGARVEVLEEKRHPADFALWKKAAPEHILRWPSPWGEGFPGWHIECTAMSTKYLGETFDIHGGGIDNIFPHNECEIAQSEAATGKPFARYWLLAGTLLINGVKMSKSLGNYITIADALKKWQPEQIRFFILSTHYRSPVDMSNEAMQAAGEGVARLQDSVWAVRRALAAAPPGDADIAWTEKLDAYRTRFLEAMDDDFNAPLALGVLFELTRETNALVNSGQVVTTGTLQAIDGLYTACAGEILGLLPLGQDHQGVDAAPFIELLIKLRQEFRAQKQWQLADRIRSDLAELGIALEDGPRGTTWKRVRS